MELRCKKNILFCSGSQAVDSSGSATHGSTETPGQSSSEVSPYEAGQSKIDMGVRDKSDQAQHGRLGRGVDKPSSSSQQGVSPSSSAAVSGKIPQAGTPPHHEGLTSSSSRYSGGDQPASSSMHQLDQSEDGGSSSSLAPSSSSLQRPGIDASDTGLSPSSSSVVPPPHPRKRAMGRPGRTSGRGDDIGSTSGVASSSSSISSVTSQSGSGNSGSTKPGPQMPASSGSHPSSSSSSLTSGSSRDRGSVQQARDLANLPESSGCGGPSASHKAGLADKTGLLSAYDFPDDPDEETPSSYMALSASSRGARKCPVDSSEGKGQGWPSGSARDSSQQGDDGKGPGERSEAQGFETYAGSGPELGSMGPGKPRARFGARVGSVEAAADPGIPVDSSTKGSQEEGGDSVDSSTSASKPGKQRISQRGSGDSTPGDSSSLSEVTQGSGDPASSADGGLGGSTGSYPAGNQWRVGGRADSVTSGGEDGGGNTRTSVISSSDPHPDSLPPPPSSSTMGGYSSAGQPVVSSMIRDPDQQSGAGTTTTTTTMCSRDQEPAPLLSSQYETLSDDDD
ncbi:hypothetical protein PoB_006517300 [Plakobranchus ocellatus]|uniref:Uncharacterized protein n=1 Tax=Plakobranchus ocellatus TaxID=259542 RepID=A0AAV4D3B5_9GAST|nr:hypothetical protein PoB_006517300 [Plakobranchus ocellatus]